MSNELLIDVIDAGIELDEHIETMKSLVTKVYLIENMLKQYIVQLRSLQENIRNLSEREQLVCLQSTNEVVRLFNTVISNRSTGSNEGIDELKNTMAHYNALAKQILEKSSDRVDFRLQIVGTIMLGLGATGAATLCAVVLLSILFGVTLAPLGAHVVAGVSLALCVASFFAFSASIPTKQVNIWKSVLNDVNRISGFSSVFFEPEQKQLLACGILGETEQADLKQNQICS